MQIEALVTYITPIESSRRALALGSVKTRFKAFWETFFAELHAALDSQVAFFINFCPQRVTKLRSLQHRKIVRRLEQPQEFIKDAQSFKS